jgi:hypothetical protein
MPCVVNPVSKQFQLVDLRFCEVQLTFEACTKFNLFALKNNKTVGETISGEKYKNQAGKIEASYPESINKKLGKFLLERKLAGDEFYLQFLNNYGDKIYSKFYFKETSWLSRKGVYIYLVDKTVMYVGKTNDSFGKRIIQGYGNISPKNCYIDGQSTNCHLNALITQNKKVVSLYLCQLNDPITIDRFEKELIQLCQPPWNIALKNSK